MATMTTSVRALQCVIVTPERAVLDEPADFVALPMFDGELGVLPGRRAMIGRLGVGELRVKQGEQSKSYVIDGGFAQIRGNTVTVLTAKAQSGAELSPAAVEKAFEAIAALPARLPEEQAAKAKAQKRARIQRQLIARLTRGGSHRHD